MTVDAATKAVVQDYAKQGKEVAHEQAELPLAPIELRTRAATAINEMRSAASDDIDPAYPVAALLHTLDARVEPTKVVWVEVVEALSDAVQVEVDKPQSSTVVAGQDAEAGILRTVVAANELRNQVSGAVDTFKHHKSAHQDLRKALFADRVQAKSRAEFEIEITSIAAALRRSGTHAPPVLLAFLPKLDAAAVELKAALPQGGKSRSEQLVWSLGVRETSYALLLALGNLLAQSFTKATPARHGRLLRAIDPKRSADSGKATKGKGAAEPGAGATPGANAGATPGAGAGSKDAEESPEAGQNPGEKPTSK